VLWYAGAALVENALVTIIARSLHPTPPSIAAVRELRGSGYRNIRGLSEYRPRSDHVKSKNAQYTNKKSQKTSARLFELSQLMVKYS
jgi:hypothetical protein